MFESDDWVEYGEARVRVFHAIHARPEDGYTAEGLERVLGLPAHEVRSALEELTADGLVVSLDGEYVGALQLD